jgi:hypothetical protein
MSGNTLRARLLSSIGMTQATEELQEGFLYAVERIARRRLGWIVFEMFSDEQVAHVKLLRQSGVPDGEVLAWIKSQMAVSYDDLYRAVVLAVVQEVEATPVRR